MAAPPRGVSWAVQFPKEIYDDPALAARAGALLEHDPAVAAYAGKLTLPEAIVAAAQRDEHVRQVLRAILTPRYPSQLIEAALEGVVLFCALWALRTLVKVPRGVITGAFFILYALLRIAGEQFRQPGSDSPFAFAFGFLTYGQLLSLFLILIGIAFLIWAFRTRQYERAFEPSEPPRVRARRRPRACRLTAAAPGPGRNSDPSAACRWISSISFQVPTAHGAPEAGRVRWPFAAWAG
jgi:phosphatidylglycerol:prolipoprotein diacylglycerol transferase